MVVADYPMLLRERLEGLRKPYNVWRTREVQDHFLGVVKEMVQDQGPLFISDIANLFQDTVDSNPKNLMLFLNNAAADLRDCYQTQTIQLRQAVKLAHPNLRTLDVRTKMRPVRSSNSPLLYETDEGLIAYIQEGIEDLGEGAIKGRFPNPLQISKAL